MECPSCKGRVVSPQGRTGEKVCCSCGTVLGKPPIGLEHFFHWNPEWHSNWRGDDSETLKDWLTTLRTVSCQLNLPNFPYREEVARRIRKDKSLLFRSQKFGKNKRATIAVLLHLVLKQYNTNRSLQEICKQLSLDSRQVAKQLWALNKIYVENNVPFTDVLRTTSTRYVFECGSKVTSDTALLLEAKKTIKKLRRNGGNPRAIASGALYYVCKKRQVRTSKEQIAEAFGISHRTVYTNEIQLRKLSKYSGTQELTRVQPHL